jgi:hypothetical protein
MEESGAGSPADQALSAADSSVVGGTSKSSIVPFFGAAASGSANMPGTTDQP